MDVVDARTLLQTPDTTFNRYVSLFLLHGRSLVCASAFADVHGSFRFNGAISAMFPWLRSYPGGLQLSEDSMNSSNGLFFQQLYAYTLIGKRTPQSASQRKEKHHKDAFMSLLETYVRGSFDADAKRVPQNGHYGASSKYQQNGYRQQQQHTPQHPQYHNQRPIPMTPTTPARDAQGRRTSASGGNQFHSAQSPSYSTAPRRLEFPPERDPSSSDSGSDNAEDGIPLRVNPTIANSPYQNSNGAKIRGAMSPTSPSLSISSSPMRRVSSDNPLDEMENVFDIVFKQQAIGMKLGADETKQYAVVKECFDNSEAARYPEIQNGVVILAVNGQEVSGLGLSRILYRLREAPRPVVVRFGRISHRQPLVGTWG